MTIPAQTSVPADHAPPEPPLIHHVELAIAYILRGGVILSILLVIAGLILTYLHHPDYITQTQPLKDIPSLAKDFPHTISDTFDSLIHFRGQGLILLGLLVLISTPVLRVAVSIFAFLLQKDRRFAIITTIVLAILLLSFFLGKAEG